MTKTLDWDLSQIAAAVQRDAALATEVLRMANSAYYNPPGRPIVDMDEAVMRIGQKRVGELALSINALSAVTPTMIPWMDLDLTWNRSMASGIALGSQAQANAEQGIALGAGSTANHALSVALGSGSQTTVGAQTGYTAAGLAAPQNSFGEVSIGAAGARAIGRAVRPAHERAGGHEPAQLRRDGSRQHGPRVRQCGGCRGRLRGSRERHGDEPHGRDDAARRHDAQRESIRVASRPTDLASSRAFSSGCYRQGCERRRNQLPFSDRKRRE